MRTVINRLLVGFLRLLPRRLASHLMFLLRSHPGIPDSWGVHIRSIHYYEPLPDFRSITRAQTEARRPSAAIAFDAASQLRLQDQLGSGAGRELRGLAEAPETTGFPFDNPYFGGLDAACYYALIRHLKPATVIEIGCGYSTRIADKALARNRSEGHPGRLVCIEPYPEARLTEYRLEMELIQQPVEEIPLDRFEALGPRDILFIDSSHVARFRSDVCREFLEILPVLKPGVWIHIHDIFFPTDYPAEWLMEKRIAFNEQYLLEAFLAFNPAFKSRCALRWLWLDHQAEMRLLWPEAVLPRGVDRGAASFWMERIA